MFNEKHGGLDLLGGKRDPADLSLIVTLFREVCEELGLSTAGIARHCPWISDLKRWPQPASIYCINRRTGEVAIYDIHYFWALTTRQHAGALASRDLAEPFLSNHGL